jgi:hypothetical protein
MLRRDDPFLARDAGTSFASYVDVLRAVRYRMSGAFGIGFERRIVTVGGGTAPALLDDVCRLVRDVSSNRIAMRCPRIRNDVFADSERLRAERLGRLCVVMNAHGPEIFAQTRFEIGAN